MRIKLWLFLICVHCLGFSALAQSPAKRQVVLQVSNGGFVSFRSETSMTGSKSSADGKSLAALYAQAFTGENRVIHRVLTDAQRNVVFAYDLWINADPITKKFSVAVLPVDDAFRRTFLKESNSPRANGTVATFPNSTTPQTLDDGDTVSLELLVNHESGTKIVDLVKVTFDRAILRDSQLDLVPKDFTLEAVELAIKNYSLLIDGSVVNKSKSSIGCAGALLWFYIPERGRFIFSLVPRAGYSFQKIAVLDENKIAFTMKGERYEWLSSGPILPNGGTWNLWVLHDAEYTPWFGAEKPIPKTARRGSNVFKKLEDALARQGAELMLGGSGSRGGTPEPVSIPLRVMIGGADSMENLLPKSP